MCSFIVKVWLSTKDLRLFTTSPELSPRFIGSFTIAKALSNSAVWLNLPPPLRRILSVFHVSRVKPNVCLAYSLWTTASPARRQRSRLHRKQDPQSLMGRPVSPIPVFVGGLRAGREQMGAREAHLGPLLDKYNNKKVYFIMIASVFGSSFLDSDLCVFIIVMLLRSLEAW